MVIPHAWSVIEWDSDEDVRQTRKHIEKGLETAFKKFDITWLRRSWKNREDFVRFCKRQLKRPHLDHNHRCHPHKTTCVKCRRGLLCADCNVKLAALEKPGWVKKAKAYLKKWIVQ